MATYYRSNMPGKARQEKKRYLLMSKVLKKGSHLKGPEGPSPKCPAPVSLVPLCDSREVDYVFGGLNASQSPTIFPPANEVVGR